MKIVEVSVDCCQRSCNFYVEFFCKIVIIYYNNVYRLFRGVEVKVNVYYIVGSVYEFILISMVVCY